LFDSLRRVFFFVLLAISCPPSPVFSFFTFLSLTHTPFPLHAHPPTHPPHSQIGFITYDSTVHLYNLRSSLRAPQQMVLADLTDIFLPQPDDLLVNLAESRHLVHTLGRFYVLYVVNS
jgi:hypothetical protein